MGNFSNNKRLHLHDAIVERGRISWSNIMLNWLSDVFDSATQLIESKGIKIIIPIVGVNLYLSSIFINIQSFANIADLIKNIILSLIGIAMGAMGVINTYFSMKKRIRDYNKEDKNKAA